MRSVQSKIVVGLLAIMASVAAWASALQPAAIPLTVAAWNYTPTETTPIKQAVLASFDFRPKAEVDAVDQWHPWRWQDRHVAFYVDGKRATDEAAAARLSVLPVLTWAHPYHYDGLDEGSFPGFSFTPEAITATEELVASARSRLRQAGLSDARLRNVLHVLDFENDGPHRPSKFADGFPTNTPHLATSSYRFGQALKAANWNRSSLGGAANYNTSHRAEHVEYGSAPYYRATPYHVPASLDGTTAFLSGYWIGGPFGCLTEAEVLDFLDRAPAPIWLALEDNQPGLTRILERAKASGKVRLVMLWGCGKPESLEWADAVGDSHRELSAGGSRSWCQKQDALIAQSLGLPTNPPRP